GINFSNNTTNFFVYVRNSFSSPRNIPKGVVTSFLKDSKENLWVSTDGGGLLVRKKGSDNFTRFSSGHHKSIIGSDAVLDLLEDKQGNIWITTYAGGLTRYTAPGNYKIYRHDIKNPYSIVSDKLLSIAESDQEIWVSTHGLGLSVLNKKTEKFRHYRHEPGNSGSIPSDWVHRIFVDRSGTLWLATFNGISEYIPQTNSFKSYRFSTDQVTGNFSYE